MCYAEQLSLIIGIAEDLINMSFFGFDPTIPRSGGHSSKAPGFGAPPDPFASISQHRDLDDDDDA